MAGNKLMYGSTGGARCYVRAPLKLPNNKVNYELDSHVLLSAIDLLLDIFKDSDTET